MRIAPVVAGLAAVVLAAGLAFNAAEAQEPGLMSEEDAEFGERVREYLLRHPEVIIEALDVWEKRREAAQAQADQRLLEDSRAALNDDGYSHVGGDPDGDVTVVEFLDYRCSYCKAAHPQVQELIASDGDIRYIVKEFPILGPQSTTAARVAMAAQRQGPEKYEALNDAMMRFRGNLDEAAIYKLAAQAGLDLARLREDAADDEIAANIRQTYALARSLRIQGTPSFVIGGEVVRGFVELDQMRALVEQAREDAG